MNGAPSHVAALARYLVEHFTRSPKAGVAGEANGRATLEYEGLTATPARVQRYLRVTEGERLDALGADRILPPTFPAVWETAAMLDLLRLGGYPLPVRGLIHIGGERVFLRPVEGGGPVRLEMKLGRPERVRSGTLVHLHSRIISAAGQLYAESGMDLLLRGVESPAAGAAERDVEAVPRAGAGEWRTLRGWTLGGGLGRRYATVSGDFNPIHLFRTTARPFGFERPILHGCCIEALVAHVLIESVLGGDPMSLRRLKISFKAPLELPAAAYLQTLERPGGGWFRVAGAEGARPYAIGEWTGLAAGAQG